jgi:hypothetical protein
MSTVTREELDANAEAVALYQQGYSIGAIAAYQSRGRGHIATVLARYGVTLRPGGRQGTGRRNHNLPDLTPQAERPRDPRHHCARCEILIEADDWLCGECHAELAAGAEWDPSQEEDA